MEMSPIEIKQPEVKTIDKDTAPGGELGKDQFMLLLVTQMQNQDPLNPMDSQATIAQLAHFSSLEQMKNLNNQFLSFRKEGQLVEALALKGENVDIQLGDGEQVQGTIDRVMWEKGDMQLDINGEIYSAADIVSIVKLDSQSR